MLITISRISLMQLADLLSSTGAPPEWRPKAEILKNGEEDGLAAVEPLGWPPRTDRA